MVPNDWMLYDDYPLLQSMLQNEEIRTDHLREEGRNQINYPKSNDGWVKSIFIIKGRALDLIIVPWLLCILHVVAYTIIQEVVLDVEHVDSESWEIFFALVLNTTLSFLLVFRLNRAAGRYWTSRELWGMIIAKSRCFLGTIITHGSHNLANRDHAIRWVVAFNIATMELLRGVRDIPADNLAGILSEEEVDVLSKNGHPAIYALDQARYHIDKLFHVDADTPAGIAHWRTRHLDSLEKQLTVALECCGGLERIRGTPLPMVYVTHLRTFLIFALVLLPYVWGRSWGWTTIPIVTLTSYAWLGIEGAAAEAESPFGATRVNALDMNSYCLGFLAVVKQQLKNHANRQILEREQSQVTKTGKPVVVEQLQWADSRDELASLP
jgi:putative membrane protein